MPACVKYMKVVRLVSADESSSLCFPGSGMDWPACGESRKWNVDAGFTLSASS